MGVVGNNVGSIGCKSAIDELVIIVIGSDESEMELGGNKLYKLTFNNGINDIVRYGGCGLLCYDFLILLQYLI